jgi:hypothetical protein
MSRPNQRFHFSKKKLKKFHNQDQLFILFSDPMENNFESFWAANNFLFQIH